MLPTPPICDPALHGCIYRVAGFPETKVSLAQICVPMPLSTGVHLCYSINFRNKLARRLKSCRPESDWSRLVEIYGLASIHPVHSSTTSYGQGISDHQPQLSRLKNSPRGWVLCDRQNRSTFRRFGCWCLLSERPPIGAREHLASPFFLPNNHPVVHANASCPPTPCRSTTSERNSGGSECSSLAGPMQAKPRSSRKSATR